MIRILISLCLFALICGCAKKSRPATDAPDSPAGLLGEGGAAKLAAPVRPALPAGWVEFKHPEGAYTVFLPAQIRPTKENMSLRQPVQAGQGLNSSYEGHVSGLSFGVVVTIFPPESADIIRAGQEHQFSNDPNVKRISATLAGRLADELTFGNYPQNITAITRRVWVGNRSYAVELVGDEPGRPTVAERATIFDSFVVGN